MAGLSEVVGSVEYSTPTSLKVVTGPKILTGEIRWDEKAGLRRDAVRSQVIDMLEAQEIKDPTPRRGYTLREKFGYTPSFGGP